MCACVRVLTKDVLEFLGMGTCPSLEVGVRWESGRFVDRRLEKHDKGERQPESQEDTEYIKKLGGRLWRSEWCEKGLGGRQGIEMCFFNIHWP